MLGLTQEQKTEVTTVTAGDQSFSSSLSSFRDAAQNKLGKLAAIGAIGATAFVGANQKAQSAEPMSAQTLCLGKEITVYDNINTNQLVQAFYPGVGGVDRQGNQINLSGPVVVTEYSELLRFTHRASGIKWGEYSFYIAKSANTNDFINKIDTQKIYTPQGQSFKVDMIQSVNDRTSVGIATWKISEPYLLNPGEIFFGSFDYTTDPTGNAAGFYIDKGAPQPDGPVTWSVGPTIRKPIDTTGEITLAARLKVRPVCEAGDIPPPPDVNLSLALDGSGVKVTFKADAYPAYVVVGDGIGLGSNWIRHDTPQLAPGETTSVTIPMDGAMQFVRLERGFVVAAEALRNQ